MKRFFVFYFIFSWLSCPTCPTLAVHWYVIYAYMTLSYFFMFYQNVKFLRKMFLFCSAYVQNQGCLFLNWKYMFISFRLKWNSIFDERKGFIIILFSCSFLFGIFILMKFLLFSSWKKSQETWNFLLFLVHDVLLCLYLSWRISLFS